MARLADVLNLARALQLQRSLQRSLQIVSDEAGSKPHKHSHGGRAPPSFDLAGLEKLSRELATRPCDGKSCKCRWVANRCQGLTESATPTCSCAACWALLTPADKTERVTAVLLQLASALLKKEHWHGPAALEAATKAFVRWVTFL